MQGCDAALFCGALALSWASRWFASLIHVGAPLWARGETVGGEMVGSGRRDAHLDLLGVLAAAEDVFWNDRMPAHSVHTSVVVRLGSCIR